MNNTLFLDIDGVLNDHKINDAGYCTIDVDKVKLINQIVIKPKVGVVLSTAWRYMIHSGECTLEGFQNWLRVFGFRGYLCGITARDEKIKNRGDQIQDYIDQFGLDSYAILDDLNDGIAHKHGNRFVQTDGRIGVTQKEIDRIVEIFTKDKQ